MSRSSSYAPVDIPENINVNFFLYDISLSEPFPTPPEAWFPKIYEDCRRLIGSKDLASTAIFLVNADDSILGYIRGGLILPKRDIQGEDVTSRFTTSGNTRFYYQSATDIIESPGNVFNFSIDAFPEFSFKGIHHRLNYFQVTAPSDIDVATPPSFQMDSYKIPENYPYIGFTQYFYDNTSDVGVLDWITENRNKFIRNIRLNVSTGLSPLQITGIGGGGGGATTYAALTDVNVAGRVDGSATHFNTTSGLYEPANEVKIDPTTRDISMTTTGAFGVVAAGNAGVQSTGADAVVAGLNARLSAPLGNAEVNGSITDILGANDVNVVANTADVNVTASAGVVDIDGGAVEIDSVGATTINAGGALVETCVGAMSMISTAGSISATANGNTARLISTTNEASIQGNSVKMVNNAARFIEIDSASKCNSNADGFQLNSIGGANNFNVNSQGGANITSTADMAVGSIGGKTTISGSTEIELNTSVVDINAGGVITIDAGSDILVNAPSGDVDITSGQNAFVNSTAGTFISGFTGVSASANNGDVILSSAKFNGKAQLRATNNLGGQVEISSAGTGAGNNIIFYKNTDTSATPSLTIAPGVGGGAAYDIFTNVAYTAPGPNSLINRSQLDAKLPDGVQGAAVPQDPFGQALVWNGTQWKAGSAIQGAPNEIATLIANGTGDVLLTATGTGNIDINTTDNTSSVDIQTGGLVVPVGGATEPTAKANNNLYAQIAGVAGTDLAILTKDFLNNLYINRSYVEFDSHGNVNLTPMNVINQFEPFANPNPVYSKTEDINAEWSVGTTPASSFTFTRTGATNVLFQYSFSVTIIGDNTGINQDKISFALYIDSGAGFVQVPTSLFSVTIAGNTDASIVSATGLARINSGWILQPRLTNTTAVRDMRIEDFKLSITECPTGVA